METLALIRAKAFQRPDEDSGRVEDWRRYSLDPAYLLLLVSVGSAVLSEP